MYKPIEISDDPPTIPPDQAAALAGGGSGGGVAGGGGGGSGSPKLAILPLANDTFRLVYDVPLENTSHVYVDAHTGDILTKDSRAPEEKIMKSPKTEFNPKILVAAIVSISIVLIGLLSWKVFNRHKK